jgi:hypothetical protein
MCRCSSGFEGRNSCKREWLSFFLKIFLGLSDSTQMVKSLIKVYMFRDAYSFLLETFSLIFSLSECLNFDYSLQICYLGILGLVLGTSL